MVATTRGPGIGAQRRTAEGVGPRTPGSFRGADVRGAHFEGASLAGADFAGARTGIRPLAKAALVGGALLASILVGVVTGWTARAMMALIADPEPRHSALGLQAAAAVIVFLVAAFWKGGEFALRVVLPVVAAMFVSAALVAIATGVGTGIGALVLLAFLAAATTVLLLGALARALAGTIATPTFLLVAVAGGLAGGAVGGGIPALVIAISAAIIAKRALTWSSRYPVLARLCVQLACRWGTRFRRADLSGASFRGADLVACDFRGARLAGTSFTDAKLTMCLFDGGRDAPPADTSPERTTYEPAAAAPAPA